MYFVEIFKLLEIFEVIVKKNCINYIYYTQKLLLFN